jgi:hypothetical protein
MLDIFKEIPKDLSSIICMASKTPIFPGVTRGSNHIIMYMESKTIKDVIKSILVDTNVPRHIPYKVLDSFSSSIINVEISNKVFPEVNNFLTELLYLLGKSLSCKLNLLEILLTILSNTFEEGINNNTTFIISKPAIDVDNNIVRFKEALIT